MGGLAAPLMAISKAISCSVTFFNVIDTQPAPLCGRRDPEVSGQDLLFHSVTFAYPTRPSTRVLNAFNAVFPQGKTTALVGPSGSGKSTIVGLIERWYQLQTPSGHDSDVDSRILVGNTNINELDVKWWRSQIGLVQQEPFLFNTTVYQNVAFGLIGSQWESEADEVKMQLVVTACKEAFADEFIDRLPEVSVLSALSCPPILLLHLALGVP